MENQLLYVEDDVDTQEFVQLWLELQGYEVTAARTASEALQLMKSNDFNLIILDNWLPDVSGIELCKRIRTFDVGIPILFFSGAVYKSDIEEAFSAGAQEYLTKPVSLDVLYYTVKRLVEGSKLHSVELSLKNCLRAANANKGETSQ